MGEPDTPGSLGKSKVRSSEMLRCSLALTVSVACNRRKERAVRRAIVTCTRIFEISDIWLRMRNSVGKFGIECAKTFIILVLHRISDRDSDWFRNKQMVDIIDRSSCERTAVSADRPVTCFSWNE